MTVVDVSAAPVLWASGSLTVALRANGVVVPKVRSQPEIPLDLAALRMLVGLASPDGLAVRDLAGAAARDLLDELAARQLVLDHRTAPTVGPAPAMPVVGSSSQIDVDRDEEMVLPTPLLLSCGAGGFDYVDHDGRVRARLSPVEVLVAVRFGVPAVVKEVDGAQSVDLAGDALSAPAFADLVARLRAADLLVPFDPSHPVHARQTRQADEMREGMRRQARVHDEFDRIEAEHDIASNGLDRVKVVGVHHSWSGLPSSLAMIIAAAKAHNDGELIESYDFRPRLFWDVPRLEAMVGGPPTIFLFSNYIWSTAQNLELSSMIKQRNPHHVTIHGGPDTPKYREDVERFFAANSHVDIAVHGEGEATFAHLLAALRGHCGDGPADLSVLRDVPGLSFRDGDRAVQTDHRDRIADLDSIPSPILTGLYDGFVPAGQFGAVIIETNRGCPYGCTFCDWGSATLSRVRKFDLDRIFAELEWCAKHNFGTVGIADANFGIFERDVDIAEKIAELKATYGYPTFVGNNYAKNTVKHLSRIIEVFTEAGIVAEGKMSMQTFDEGTLATIRRKNIKVEKYYDLSGEFRRNQLPLVVDIMMGLPGSTPATFRNDLQECINRAVRAAIHSTLLLTNSPMNEPSYREENGIVARPGEEVKETSTFTPDEWEQMNRLTTSFYVLENFGVLRQVATYVRAETGTREIDFYERLGEDVNREPERWPFISLALQVLPELMVPPVSWKLLLDEVRTYLVEQVGIVDDDALDTVLAVQHALLPARDRTFPDEIHVAHDYGAWFAEVAEVRGNGLSDRWHEAVEPLRNQGPGTFVVRDPFDVCTTALGGSLRSLVVENAWDLDSVVSRPRQRLVDEPFVTSN